MFICVYIFTWSIVNSMIFLICCLVFLFPILITRWCCSCCCWRWAMPSKSVERKLVGNAITLSRHYNQDHTVCPSWNLARLEMGNHWTPLPSKMQFFISSPSLIRGARSFTCHLGGGSLEVSISRATSPSSWRKVPSFLDLRYCFLVGKKLLVI